MGVIDWFKLRILLYFTYIYLANANSQEPGDMFYHLIFENLRLSFLFGSRIWIISHSLNHTDLNDLSPGSKGNCLDHHILLILLMRMEFQPMTLSAFTERDFVVNMPLLLIMIMMRKMRM